MVAIPSRVSDAETNASFSEEMLGKSCMNLARRIATGNQKSRGRITAPDFFQAGDGFFWPEREDVPKDVKGVPLVDKGRHNATARFQDGSHASYGTFEVSCGV